MPRCPRGLRCGFTDRCKKTNTSIYLSIYILCHEASSSVSFKSPCALLHDYPLPERDLVLLCPGPCSTLHLNDMKSNSDLHNPSAISLICTFIATLFAWPCLKSNGACGKRRWGGRGGREQVGEEEEEEEERESCGCGDAGLLGGGKRLGRGGMSGGGVEGSMRVWMRGRWKGCTLCCTR